MKIFKILFFLTLLTLIGCNTKSPRQQANGKIDGVAITVDYGAPSVKGRTIWGGLEPYDKVWRAGANENTTVSFDKNVIINGQPLPAGKYGFFIIPKEHGDWIVIFNKKNDEWGAFSYKQEEDALRVALTPQFTTDVQEQLKYSVADNAIGFAWEKVRLNIPVKKQ